MFVTKTTVAVLATKIEQPTESDIKRSIWWYTPVDGKVLFLENLDQQSHLWYIERLVDFYYRNKSKIADLIKNSHISLFLLAHQTLITQLGYDFQDQKSVKVYHKLRDTYGKTWNWEKLSHFRWIRYTVNWYTYVKWWRYSSVQSNNFSYNKDILLKLQISFPITRSIQWVDNSNFYEINLSKWTTLCNKSFLRYKKQLGEFEKEFKKHFDRIQTSIAPWKEIHLLMNVAAPFAFIIGQNLHSSGPTVHLYEEHSQEYIKIFSLKRI